MKTITFFILVCILTINAYSQEITTNRNAIGMEHNMLFNAQDRYEVTQTGSATLSTDYLFNGIFAPTYTATAPSVSDPTIIEISGLPNIHIQQGAWIGWSTRFWAAKRFKIEGFDEYYGNGWTILADYENTDFTGYDYIVKCAHGSYTKLRFTFYEATGTDGKLGVSELYFLHPEATSPYKGLLGSAIASWDSNGNDIYYNEGKVGIGTTNPDDKLYVSGDVGTTGRLSLRDNQAAVGDIVSLYGDRFGLTNMYGFGVESGTTYYKAAQYHRWYILANADDGISSKMELNSNRLYIADNVGIGTKVIPTGYKLAVDGTIGAREVIVTTDVWADFVFESNYNLMTLADLKKFIKTNKHLPEIPTTAEVEENGISVGEMNAKLLQKIEELTLYIIQMEERLTDLEKNKVYD